MFWQNPDNPAHRINPTCKPGTGFSEKQYLFRLGIRAGIRALYRADFASPVWRWSWVLAAISINMSGRNDNKQNAGPTTRQCRSRSANAANAASGKRNAEVDSCYHANNR